VKLGWERDHAGGEGSGVPAPADGDQFIPVRKIDILDALVEHSSLAGDDHDKFRQLCRLVGAIYHYDWSGCVQTISISVRRSSHTRGSTTTRGSAPRSPRRPHLGAQKRELHRAAARRNRPRSPRPRRAARRKEDREGPSQHHPRCSRWLDANSLALRNQNGTLTHGQADSPD
jgi:hypothetical protein